MSKKVIIDDEKQEEKSATSEKTVAPEVTDWKDQYIRLLADYQNLTKRTATEKEQAILYGVSSFITVLLPVFDTLELAFKHTNDAGIGLALKQLQTAFDSLGVVKVQALGRQFDPAVMECIELTNGDSNIVVDELSQGYIYKQRVIRPARVRVGSGSKSN